MPRTSSQSELDSLLENIDKQLLLKLLDALIDEQGIKTHSTQE